MSKPLAIVPEDPLAPDYVMWIFESTDQGFTISIVNGEGERQISSLGLDAHALEDLGDDLVSEWQTHIGFDAEATPLQSALTQPLEGSLLANLAFAGNYALQKLLESILEPEVRRNALESLKRHVTPGLSTNCELVIMSDFLFPWRLIYVDPCDVERIIPAPALVGEPPPSPDGFLGIAGVVDHIYRDSHSSVRPSGSRIIVGAHASVRGSLESLLPMLLTGKGLEWDLLTNEEELFVSIQRRAPLVYLFCHGRTSSKKNRTVYQLTLRGSHYWTPMSLIKRLPTVEGRPMLLGAPLTMINACSSAECASDASKLLTDAGAGCTLGPVVDIPKVFASEFGSRVLRLVLQNESMTDAVLTISRLFIHEYRNPLGLAYMTSYGRNSRLPIMTTN